MTTDPIAAARAMIEPLTGYTPGPWRALDESECYSHDDGNTVSMAIGKRDNHAFALAMHKYSDRIVDANAALIAAAPDLRDMVATLADAVEVERAKVAAAFAMQDAGYSMTTPADAQAALDKLLAEARLEGWRAGRDASAKIVDETAKYHMSDPDDIEVVRLTAAEIRALPEPKETSHE